MFVDTIENFFLKILERIGLKGIANFYRVHQEGMRYLVFGALTTVVNIISYILFRTTFFKAIENEQIKINISEIIAFIIAVLFAYITNKIYVFKSKTKYIKELIKEIISFISCRIFTEIISILMMNISVWLNINDIIMKIVSNIIVIILNYILSKILIFKNKKY